MHHAGFALCIFPCQLAQLSPQHPFLPKATFGDLAPAALAQKHVAVGFVSAMKEA